MLGQGDQQRRRGQTSRIISAGLSDPEAGFSTVVVEGVPPGIDLAEAKAAADGLPVIGGFLETRLRGVRGVGSGGDGPAGFGDPDGEVLDVFGNRVIDA